MGNESISFGVMDFTPYPVSDKLRLFVWGHGHKLKVQFSGGACKPYQTPAARRLEKRLRRNSSISSILVMVK